MSVPANPGSQQNHYLWYPMFLEALCEADTARMRMRIQEAESVLLARERAINGFADHSEERQAISATLLALRSLRECLESRNTRSAAA